MPNAERIPRLHLKPAESAFDGVIAFPTDTFYALGVNALDEASIRCAFRLKRRPATTPMPVLVADMAQVESLTAAFGDAHRVLAAHFWPGALTIVADAAENVPSVLTGGLPTVGLRMPNHARALETIAETRCALTGTSANISGTPPTKDWRIVAEQFGDRLTAIVKGDCGVESQPSTVVQISAANGLLVFREGAISRQQIQPVLDGDL